MVSGRVPVSCGVDVGSTNSKVVVIDEDGRVRGRVGRPTPRRASDGTIDARELLTMLESMVVSLCAESFEIHAVCSAGMGEDGVIVDPTLEPLVPALAWFDPRRRDALERLAPGIRETCRGDVDIDQTRTIVGWAWARERVARASGQKWVALADFAGVNWSGQAFLSDTTASRTGAWCSSDGEWSTGAVEATLGSTDALPSVVRSGQVIGPARSDVLEAAGVLAVDAVVVAGGHDHTIAGWSVGQAVPGSVLDSMGTAEVVVGRTDEPVVDRAGLDITREIGGDGSMILRVEELTRNFEWAARDPSVAACLHEILDGHADLLEVAEDVFFLPGEPGGVSPAFARRAPADPRVRASAVLWALALTGRDAIDMVRRRMPVPGAVGLAGGWTRSPGWIALKARVHGGPLVHIGEPEVTAVGAALLAARSRGGSIDPATALVVAPA